MAEETVTTQPAAPTDLAAAITRRELDQKSTDPAIVERKAALTPQPRPESVAPKADLLDAIRQDHSIADPDLIEQVEALKKAHEKADANEEEEGEEEAAEEEEQEQQPQQPQIPREVKAVMDALGLEPEDLQDPRWQSVISKELNAQQETPEARQQAMTDHISRLQTATEHIYKGDLTEIFINDLTKVNQIADPRQRAEATTRIMIGGAVNLLNQLVPEMLASYAPQVIERAAPGFTNMYISAQNENAWNEAGADELFEYGTPEMLEACSKTFETHPWIGQIPSLVGRAEAIKNVLEGQKYSPKRIQEAIQSGIELGRKQEQGYARKVSAGKALSSGKSKGEFSESRKNTDLHDAIVQYMKNQRSLG